MRDSRESERECGIGTPSHPFILQNEPLYNEVLDITNDFLYSSNSKMYGKEPRCNETLL